MPSQPNGNAADNGAAKSSLAKRFELPALDFKFSSLTDGTNIPAPMPSPKEETPPEPPKQASADAKSKDHETKTQTSQTNGQANGSEKTPKPDNIDTSAAAAAGACLKRPLEESPASPTMSTSRGSLRRLLSRSFMSTNTYDDKASISGQSEPYARAPSRASVQTDERKAKRGSGWFRRLRSGGGGGGGAAPEAPQGGNTKRASKHFDIARKPVGPPPPMIPELSALESKVDTQIGEDLFKGIK